MSKIKVLTFLPGGVGGAERMTITIAKLFPKDRFEFKFIVMGRLKQIYDFLPEGYDYDCIPTKNIMCFSTYKMYRMICKEKPDIVFCSQVAYNPRAVIASKLSKVPVVIRSSGMVSTYKTSKFLQVKATYKFADAVIAQQDDMRNELIDLLGVSADRAFTLHNPLDTSEITKKSVAKSPYPRESQVNFCNVARINRDKGHDIAILAMVKVLDEIPNAHFYFVGNYDMKDEYYLYLQDLISASKIKDNIHFVGYTDNPYCWIKNCDCFVFPSRREGLPNALIEASYLGKPCVAARCLNIVDEIIADGENGYTVPVDDVQSLSDSMIKAISLKNCEMQYHPANKNDFVQLFESIVYLKSATLYRMGIFNHE